MRPDTVVMIHAIAPATVRLVVSSVILCAFGVYMVRWLTGGGRR